MEKAVRITFYYFVNLLAEYYQQVGIVLTSTKANEVEYEGGIQGQNRDNWIKVDLESGQHSIFVSLSFQQI